MELHVYLVYGMKVSIIMHALLAVVICCVILISRVVGMLQSNAALLVRTLITLQNMKVL
jgi:hypothetical protein